MDEVPDMKRNNRAIDSLKARDEIKENVRRSWGVKRPVQLVRDADRKALGGDQDEIYTVVLLVVRE